MTVLPSDDERPEPPEPSGMAARWSPIDPRQRETHRRLRLFGEAPAGHFLDACELMDRNTMRATTHLVAHSLRELDGGIRAVLASALDQEARERVASASLTHKAEIEEISTLLFGTDAEELAREWWSYASRLHELTHRHSLRAPRPVDDEFRDWWAEGQVVIHRVSRQYETVYAEAMPRIDALAAKAAPVAADLTELRERVPHSAVALDRFFTAATPGWFRLLRDAGYFADPPSLQPDEEGRVAFVPWPPGGYLARLAGDDGLRPEVVALALALETDNPDAHQAVVDIALASPADVAAELAAKVAEFLATPFQWRLPFKTRDLIVHLIGGGQVAAALGLLRALVSPSVRQRDQWRDTSLLRELVPQVFPAAGVAGLELLADLISEQLQSDERTRTRDYSYIWRPTLAGGRRGDIRDTLVSALRDAAALVVENEPARVGDAVALLEARERSIFGRLALDLLRRFPDDVFVAERLGDRARFDDINLEREYDELARDRFATLPAEVQQRVLGWIEEGEADEPDEHHRERWQLRQLVRLGDALPAEWHARLDELAARHGPPAERPPRGVIRSGASAPIERDELAAKNVREVIEYLRTWAPEDAFGGPSREGLSRLLDALVAEDPARFAAEAPAFAEVEPIYARAVIAGLQKAANGERAFEWPPVLELARRTLEQARRLPRRRADEVGDAEPGWISARTDIARLMETALAKNLLAPDLAGEVFALIETLVADPHPDRAHEQEFAAEGTDPATLSLNSVRGAAFHALMHYAWWRRKQTPGGQEPRFEERVRQLLDRHLDQEIEDTKAVRSVYGQWFPFLVDCDSAWAAARVEAIFPFAGDHAALGRAAWESYVVHNRAWPDAFRLLRTHYRAAVERLLDEDDAADDERRESLVGHLIGLYIRGAVELDDDILGRFLAAAPAALRVRFIELIGIDLMNAESEVADETLTRLRALWEARLAAATVAEEAAALSELSGFAWWFASAKFADDWSLAQLTAVLEAGAGVDPDHTVIERLAALHVRELPAAARALALLIDVTADPWFVLGAPDEIRTILAAGLASDDIDVQNTARRATSRLVARGHPNFGDLLQPPREHE